MVLTTTTNDARRRPATKKKAATVRVDGDDGAPVAGGDKGRAAELLHPLAHLLATAGSGGDGGDGGATRPKDGRRRRRLNTRAAAARRHGRPRERGQTKEDDEGMLYKALD
jgi:Domain of unknown function (DUF834).